MAINTKGKVEIIKKMNEAISHRGPDGDGYLVKDNLALGHVRLSIIDVSESGKQPLKSDDLRYAISFNGEIINYKELSKIYLLEEAINDTSVALKCFLKFGGNWCIDNFRGMYAFIVTDFMTGKVTLIRDPFGIKPLYYSKFNEYFIASSEINGIIASEVIPLDINSERVFEYFTERHVKAPNTLFQHIKQVQPGEILEIENSNIVKKQILFPTAISNKTENLENLLEKIILNWTISDVKVGTYLSGGLDSSLISAIVRSKNKNLESWCAYFTQDEFNESNYAKIVAKQNGIHLNLTHIDDSNYLIETLNLIKKKGYPLSVPNEIALTRISESMKGNIKVALSGEGADELFGGYNRILNKKVGSTESFFDQYNYVPLSILDKLGIDTRLNIERNILFENGGDSYQERSFNYFRKYHLEGLLMRVDFASMQNSIETRPCLVDLDLYRHVKSIPLENHFDEYQEGKKELKNIAKKWLDSDIIYRKKVGFPVPLNNLSRSIHLKIIAELNQNSNRIISLEKYKSAYEEIQNQNNHGQILWMIYNLINWEKTIKNLQ